MTQTTKSSDNPPPFEPANVVELVSQEHSKITGVSLYSTLAEITRLYRVSVVAGLNQVNISGLPNALDQDSIRVEGRGAATIHDVTVSRIPPIPAVSTSEALAELLAKKEKKVKALERAEQSLTSLKAYLGTLNVQHVDAGQLTKVMENYDSTGEILDDRVFNLSQELDAIDVKLQDERHRLAGPKENTKLKMQATIGVFAEAVGEIQLILIYAVNSATWNAGYDIRVAMDTKEKPISLTYKAIITQNTGEEWEDIPLTLETATPSFGVGVPTLDPWRISTYASTGSYSKSRATMEIRPRALRSAALLGGGESSALLSSSHELEEFLVSPAMKTRELAVDSKGNVSATFRVPGIISIPSDGVAHNFTIVKLDLDATMTWISVPKKDTRVHLKAKIINLSEYTLLPGNGSVYVDGSFISRTEVPSVSPQESFDCSLGLDPSIRITYHPRVKKRTETGFVNKTSNHVFTQRISIHNTKTVSVGHLRIVDQIPYSQNSEIVIKLVSPALPINSGGTSNKAPTAKSLFQPCKVGDGITAMWDGSDDPDCDVDALGHDGKLNWIASVAPQGKINLTLQWEVTSPAKSRVFGLD